MNPIFRDAGLQKLFERDGYVLVDFLDGAEIARLLDLHRKFRNFLRRDFDASYFAPEGDYRRAVHLEVGRVFGGRLARFLDFDHKVCSCGYVVKKAASRRSELPFHQDLSFADEARFDSLTVWCPLVDVDERSGCLSFVAGSHELNRKPRGQGMPRPYRELFSNIDPRLVTPMPMKAGQAIFQSLRLFHGSGSNLLRAERVATYANVVQKDAPLLFYFHDLRNDPKRLEVFEVGDDFYVSYVPGTFARDVKVGTRFLPAARPDGVKSLGFIDYEFEPITEESLRGSRAPRED